MSSLCSFYYDFKVFKATCVNVCDIKGKTLTQFTANGSQIRIPVPLSYVTSLYDPMRRATLFSGQGYLSRLDQPWMDERGHGVSTQSNR